MSSSLACQKPSAGPPPVSHGSGRAYRGEVAVRIDAQAEGNLRIDLVVRGGGRKLAIGCDGDKFHGPDQWEDDLRRQNVLERLGWRFWRVRGSGFYRDPEAAMASLWPLLNELDIRPSDESTPDPRSYAAGGHE